MTGGDQLTLDLTPVSDVPAVTNTAMVTLNFQVDLDWPRARLAAHVLRHALTAVANLPDLIAETNPT